MKNAQTVATVGPLQGGSGPATRFDVNSTLLRHLATASGAASILRSVSPTLPELVAQFFRARTDVRRLHEAQKVAKAILDINDFSDLMDIRNIVAKQELMRLIKYGKQKDHTAHTVYLYLLGLWFFDNVSTIRDAVRHRSGQKTHAKVCEWFLFQWVNASLLHDVGYAFHDLSERTQADRKLIDSIYSWEWLRKWATQERAVSKATLRALEGAHATWRKVHEKRMPAATATYAPNAFTSIIDRLSRAPWLEDIKPGWKGKNIFDVLVLPSKRATHLQAYATEVASKGYGGKGQCVDHAVASGLLLFQYTSYWYWIIGQLRGNAKAYKEATGKFDYSMRNVTGPIVDACTAVAYHNIQPNVNASKAILPHITLKKEPVLFLAVVCDELQMWDRYPAGDNLLANYREFAASSVESDDLELACAGTDVTCGRVRIIHEKGPTLRESLVATLEGRAPGYKALVEIIGDKP